MVDAEEWLAGFKARFGEWRMSDEALEVLGDLLRVEEGEVKAGGFGELAKLIPIEDGEGYGREVGQICAMECLHGRMGRTEAHALMEGKKGVFLLRLGSQRGRFALSYKDSSKAVTLLLR